jgi:type IV pilus assembly protein PilN
MIRINLLGVERRATKKSFSFDISQQAPALCGLILLAAAAGTGWWYWSLTQESQQVDTKRAAADREVQRLKAVMAEVAQFEARTKQLQDRVQLIERLRAGQGVPVQLLDHVSRSLPETLWLTDLKQEGAEVVLKGRSTTLIALSDFVGSLGNTALLQKPIEIVDSKVEEGREASRGGDAVPDLISFTVRAQVVGAEPAEPPTPRKGRG